MGAHQSHEGNDHGQGNAFDVTDLKQVNENDVKQESSNVSFNQTKRAWASEPVKSGYLIASVTQNVTDTVVQEFDENNDKVDSVKRLSVEDNLAVNPQTATKSLAEQLKVQTPGTRKSAIITGPVARAGPSHGSSPFQSTQSINVPEDRDNEIEVEESALGFLHKQHSHVVQ